MTHIKDVSGLAKRQNPFDDGLCLNFSSALFLYTIIFPIQSYTIRTLFECEKGHCHTRIRLFIQSTVFINHAINRYCLESKIRGPNWVFYRVECCFQGCQLALKKGILVSKIGV